MGDDPHDNLSKILVISLSASLGTIVLAALLVLMFWRRKRKRTRNFTIRRTIKNPYSDFPQPPSLDHINKLESWTKETENLRTIIRQPVKEVKVVGNARIGSSTHIGSSSPGLSKSTSYRSTSPQRLTFHNSGAIASNKVKSESSSSSETKVSSDYSAGSSRGFIQVKL